jgi:hypothetical protein
MNTAARIRCLMVLTLAMAVAGFAAAEVTVSVTLEGDLDEIIPILQQLQLRGVGAGVTVHTGEGIPIEVHSVAGEAGAREAPDGAATGEAALDPPMPQQSDAVTLGAPDLAPRPVAPGETLTVVMPVNDPRGRIDTIGAGIRGIDGGTFDLYDNGTRGDETAADADWTGVFTVPDGAAPGDYALSITAYDINGMPLRLPGADDDAVVQRQARIEVREPGGEAAAPAPE